MVDLAGSERLDLSKHVIERRTTKSTTFESPLD